MELMVIRALSHEVLAGSVGPSAEGHLGRLALGLPGWFKCVCPGGHLFTVDPGVGSLSRWVSVWSAFTDAAQSFPRNGSVAGPQPHRRQVLCAFLSVALLGGAVVAHVDFH